LGLSTRRRARATCAGGANARRQGRRRHGTRTAGVHAKGQRKATQPAPPCTPTPVPQPAHCPPPCRRFPAAQRYPWLHRPAARALRLSGGCVQRAAPHAVHAHIDSCNAPR
jgi:hypothetical protein